MGLRSWLQRRVRGKTGHRHEAPCPADEAATATPASASETDGLPADGWRELPAYLPVDPREHMHACVIASALAAGDYPESAFVVRGIKLANPEHRLVTCIASALAAATHETSTFQVKRIFKLENKGDGHAA